MVVCDSNKNYENLGFDKNDLRLLIIKSAYKNIKLRDRAIRNLLLQLQNPSLCPYINLSKLKIRYNVRAQPLTPKCVTLCQVRQASLFLAVRITG